MEIYLTAEVPMGINIDQLRVQRNRYQMTPSNTYAKHVHSTNSCLSQIYSTSACFVCKLQLQPRMQFARMQSYQECNLHTY